MSNGETPLQSYFKKQPQKQKSVGGVLATVNQTKTVPTIPDPTTNATVNNTRQSGFSSKFQGGFGNISDLTVNLEGKRYNETTGTYYTAGDFTKLAVGGGLGVIYNAAATLSGVGKGFQIGVKVTGIVAGVGSSMLQDNKGFVEASATNVLAFGFKNSTFGYDWAKNLGDKFRQKVIGKSNIPARILNNMVERWQSSGAWVYKNVYHNIPTINPFGIIPGGHHYGFAALPVPQLLESYLGKTAAKKTVGLFKDKEQYEPYVKGQGLLNYFYYNNSEYTPNPASGIQPVIDYAKEVQRPKSTYLRTRQMIVPTNVVAKKPAPEKTEKEKLQEFVLQFEKMNPMKTYWAKRLDRILHPERYHEFDRALDKLIQLKDGEKATTALSAASWIAKVAFEDIAKSISNIFKGVSNKLEIESGNDANSVLALELAKFKTDIEAAGGKFTIQTNGLPIFTLPPEREVPQAQLKTYLKPPPKNSGEAEVRFAEQQQYNAKVQNNLAVVREQIRVANRIQEDANFRKFIGKKYKVDVMNRRLGANLENIQKLTGRSKTEVLAQFFTEFPQYRSKEEKKVLQAEYNQHFYQD